MKKRKGAKFDWGLLSEVGHRKAEKYLRSLPDFDYVAWQKRKGPKEILEEKFGPSEHCFSILTLSALKDNLVHFRHCNACHKGAERWGQAQERMHELMNSPTRHSSKGGGDLPPELL